MALPQVAYTQVSASLVTHVHDLDRQRATLSAEYLRWRAITGSGKELNYFTEYCRRSKSRTGLYTKSHTYDFDRELATATATVF